jgi:tRNA threonylcarbamoyladenosine biosynthesis protein TsaE
MTTRFWTTSEAETVAAGRTIAATLPLDGVLLLSGDLGAGKTVLTRGVAEHLGIAREEIQSPTFTLIREHEGEGGRLIHADLYRLDPDQVDALGLDELLAGPGIKVIEWAERLPYEIQGAVSVEILREERDGILGREIVVA